MFGMHGCDYLVFWGCGRCRFQEIVTLLKNSVTAAQNAARDYGAGGKAGGKSMCSGPSVGDSLLGVKDCW